MKTIVEPIPKSPKGDFRSPLQGMGVFFKSRKNLFLFRLNR